MLWVIINFKMFNGCKNRGILSRMDQNQAGPPAIPCAGSGKGTDGNALGLPHIQPAAVDPLEEAPHSNSVLREEESSEKGLDSST